MKVGDVVIQGGDLIKLKGIRKSRRLGAVIAIHEDTFPEDWETNSWRKNWAKQIGRRIDVMWSNNKLSKNFAENALAVVAGEEITSEERDILNIALTSDMINNGLKIH